LINILLSLYFTKDNIYYNKPNVYFTKVNPTEESKMNFIEALKQAKQGKSIRRKSWNKHKGFSFKDDRLVLTGDVAVFAYNTDDIEATDWEVVNQSVVVKLNDEYTATVYQDYIHVVSKERSVTVLPSFLEELVKVHEPNVKYSDLSFNKAIQFAQKGFQIKRKDKISVYSLIDHQLTAQCGYKFCYNSDCDKTDWMVLEPVSRLKLNSQYEVEVSKDTIKVGCQTFPISKLHDLIEAHKSV
jgi:hypothetical protein